jgi:hypothetical protein
LPPWQYHRRPPWRWYHHGSGTTAIAFFQSIILILTGYTFYLASADFIGIMLYQYPMHKSGGWRMSVCVCENL